MKELNIHFADSLILFRNLTKEKHAGLKQDDGSFVKINKEALYKHLFGTDFQGHDALEDEKALSKIPFKSWLQLSLSKIVNRSGTADINSAIADINYLDRSHALLKSFDGMVGDPSNGGVMKKSTAKKLADSGLGFHQLKSLFDTQGEQGLLAKINGSTNQQLTSLCSWKCRTVSEHVILNHFKEIQSWIRSKNSTLSFTCGLLSYANKYGPIQR